MKKISAALLSVAFIATSASAEERPLCDSVLATIQLGQLFQASLDHRIAGNRLTPVEPSALGGITKLQSLTADLASCPETNYREIVLRSWAQTLLEELTSYSMNFASFRTSSQIPFAQFSEPLSGIDLERKTIGFIDAGFNVSGVTASTFTMKDATGAPVRMLGPLSTNITWDLADLDAAPYSGHEHGNKVMLTFQSTLETLVANLSLGRKDIPLMKPVKFMNFYELAGFTVPLTFQETSKDVFRGSAKNTEWTNLAETVKAAKFSMLNFSGSFDGQKAPYEPFRKFLIENPKVFLVAAAGNQNTDLDAPDFPLPWPSKFLDDGGKRLPNVINVTTAYGNKVKNNWGKEYVDVAIEASSTSFAAPKISAILHVLDAKYDCFRSKSPREVLKALASTVDSQRNIPVLDMYDLTHEKIVAACDVK